MSEVLSDAIFVYPMAVTDRSLWDALKDHSPGFFQAAHDDIHDTWTITPLDPPVVLETCAPEPYFITVEDEHTAWLFNLWAEATLADAAVFYCESVAWNTLYFLVV